MIYLLTDSPNLTGPRSIGAYRLATVLRRAGFDVEVIDYLKYWDPAEVIKYIRSGPTPLWIGFSSTFSGPNKNEIINVSNQKSNDCLTCFNEKELFFWQELKKKSKLVIGGARAERLKYFYDADFIVTGYADEAVVPLSRYLLGKSKDLKFKEEIVESLKSPGEKYIVKKINCEESYPMTDVSDISTEFHKTDFIKKGEVLPLEISRGCIFKCSFCAFPLNGKSKNDYIRPKEQIKNDIKIYQEKYKSNQYLIMDDTFNDTVEKMQMMKEIHDELGPFDFWAYGRLDLIAAKKEMLELIDKIGWKYFSFGVETFKKDAGKKIGKGADPDKLKKTIKDIKEKHPESWLLFEMIVGLPGETEESINETYNWFDENRELWEEIHFKELYISNPKYNIWNSKMSLNPEKFGINLTTGTDSKEYILFWEHDTMDTKKAMDLTKELSQKLNLIKPWRKNNYFRDFLRVSKKLDKDASVNSFLNRLRVDARLYVELKLRSRGLKNDLFKYIRKTDL
jgi:radical SAM superfamily enzyme YgiQ (UPF0313 family)